MKYFSAKLISEAEAVQLHPCHAANFFCRGYGVASQQQVTGYDFFVDK